MFPLPRRVRAVVGPHNSCLVTAETFQWQERHHKLNGPTYRQRGGCVPTQRFLLFLGVGLLCMAIFMVLGAIFKLSTLGMRLFLRFQFTVTVLLVVVSLPPLDFGWLNTILLISLKVLSVLVGGFGYICLIFTELC